MKFLPTEALLIKGKGESDTSKINAWDNALLDVNIANLNFVAYTSILPKDVKFRDFRNELTPGQEVKVVISKIFGRKSDILTAGLAYGFTDVCGLIAKFSQKCKENCVDEKLRKMVDEMVRNRKLKIEDMKIETEKMVVKKNFGCVFVAIIFNPNNYR